MDAGDRISEEGAAGRAATERQYADEPIADCGEPGWARCVACGAAARLALCRACLAELAGATGQGPPAIVDSPPPAGCARVFCARPYVWPLAPILLRFKHRADPVLGAALALVLREALAAHLTEALHAGAERGSVAMIPVPLHGARLASRGCNQAEVLARPLARACGVALRGSILKRVRATTHQQGQTRRQRLRNLHGAFRASGPVPALCLLVDDVLTTGATLSAAAKALHAAGAREVWAVTLLRA